jgi:hypothetical protein
LQGGDIVRQVGRHDRRGERLDHALASHPANSHATALQPAISGCHVRAGIRQSLAQYGAVQDGHAVLRMIRIAIRVA